VAVGCPPHVAGRPPARLRGVPPSSGHGGRAGGARAVRCRGGDPRRGEHSHRPLLGVLVARPSPARGHARARPRTDARMDEGRRARELDRLHAALRILPVPQNADRPPGGTSMNPMPDHWNYVLAAYGLAAIGLIGYWRYLAARARTLSESRRGKGRRA